jgi:sphingomyelin phosphodiesterase
MRTRSVSPRTRSLPRSRHVRFAGAVVGCAAVALTAVPLARAGAAPKAEGAAQPAAAAAARPLRILTDNVMFLPSLVADYGHATRADLIARADHLRGHDVVVFQELFENGPSNRLLANLRGRYPHQTPVLGRSRSGWDRTAGDYRALTPEDGGVAVVSRWPIRKRVQYVYKPGCGADWFANKGFVYVQVDVAGTPLHVFGTHAQAEDSACRAGQPAAVRAAQFRELDAFVDAQRIPAGQHVVVAGDLNVNRFSPEYRTMLGNLEVVAPERYTGHTYSFDPARNGIAGERYPGTAREHLDYVLFRRGNARPARWANETLVPQTPAPYQVTRWFKTYSYTDYSDHYPVLGAVGGAGRR